MTEWQAVKFNVACNAVAAAVAILWSALATPSEAAGASDPAAAPSLRFEFATAIDSQRRGVPVTLTLVNAPEGNTVDIALAIPSRAGDLLGLFGNLVDESLAAQIRVVDPSGLVTRSRFRANGVTHLSEENNLRPLKNWDFGLEFGRPDSKKKKKVIESVSFRLSAPGLTLAQLIGAANRGFVIGVRLRDTGSAARKVGLPEGQMPDVVGATISIESPSDGSFFASQPIAVTGAVTGTDVAVLVNGIAATVSGGRFSASAPLSEGSNTLVATASNALPQAVDQVSVTLDTIPPTVTITSPVTGTVVLESSAMVTGTVVDATPVQGVIVNGQAAVVADGSFVATVPLVAGVNTIQAIAADSAGNQGSSPPISVSLGVCFPGSSAACYEGPPGTEGVGSCAAGSRICAEDGQSFGACTGQALPAAEVCNALDDDCDGAADEELGTTTCGAGICAHTVANCEGGVPGTCDPFEGAVAEVCGNGLDDDCDGSTDEECGEPSCVEGTACVTGEPGVCSPGLTTCPSGPFGPQVCSRITGPSAEICDALDNDCDGVVDDGFEVGSLCETGQPGICAAGTLACGESGATICVATSQAQPEVCNDSIDQDCDGRDCVVLAVEIASPAADLVTAAESIEISGSVGAGVTSVVVNGVAASLSGSSFSATVPLRDGPNMLVAIGHDDDGNTGTDSVQVTRDGIAPRVVISSPTDGYRAIVDRVTVTGIVNDFVAGGVEPRVVVNGLEGTVKQGTFLVVDVPLLRGPNPVVAIATDSVGNEGRDEISVSFDPPAGALLQPFSGDGQADLVGTELPQPLVARVVDQAGNALAGRVVRFEVTRDSGTLRTDTGQTGRAVEIPSDGSGLARAFLTLGDRAGEGNNRVQASSVGASGEAIFGASALAALPDKILFSMGENQKGLAGTSLPEAFEVIVVDPDGNPVAGVPVTFSVVEGGGHFDGAPQKSLVTGADGLARAVLTLGPSGGLNNNVAEAAFPDNPGLPATFIATGLIAGAVEDTRFAGVVLDNTNTPIPGTTVRIGETSLEAITDGEGQFLLSGVPVGHVDLFIDPSTSPRPEVFPPLHFEVTTVAGQVNRLSIGPIRIPPLVSEAKVVGGDEDVTLTMPGVPGLTLTVFAHSARFHDGSRSGLVSINQVHLDKVPMAPPNGIIFTPPAWTVQPAGTTFDPPAQISIPNPGLPPGRVIDLFQFDHDINRFVSIGPGTVGEDGLLIVSDRGFGITKAGWGGGGPPQPPPTCTSSCNDQNRCTSDGCVNGSCNHQPINTTPSAASMCEGCDNGKPRNKKTKAECCSDNTVTGNPITTPKTHAWVVCCNAVKTSCVKPTPKTRPFSDLLDSCAEKHEEQHFGDIDCPTTNECKTSRPGFKDGRCNNPNGDCDGECDAYKVTIACLKGHDCMGNRACQDALDKHIEFYENTANGKRKGCVN